MEETLKYVAWRNNTWSTHLHVGVRGTDRAVVLCDALRGYLPHLLALSANSPFIEEVWTQLHSARAQTFVRMFPRCGIPDAVRLLGGTPRFYEQLVETQCIREFTQVWWSVRPHHAFGTVEVRICDAQTELWQTLAVQSLAYALVATLAREFDLGRVLPVLENRYVEENLWRAIRYGMNGKLVDFKRGREVPAADAIKELLDYVWPAAERLGVRPFIGNVERMLREGNGAQQQMNAHQDGKSLREVFAGTVEAAHRSPSRSSDERGESDGGRSRQGDPGRRADAADPRAAEERARVRPRLRDDGGNFGSQKMGLLEETREVRDLADARLSIQLVRAILEVIEREQGAEAHARAARRAGADATRLRARGAARQRGERRAAREQAREERRGGAGRRSRLPRPVTQPGRRAGARGGGAGREEGGAEEARCEKKPAAKKKPAGDS